MPVALQGAPARVLGKPAGRTSLFLFSLTVRLHGLLTVAGDKIRKDGGNEASRLPRADSTDRLLVATGSKPPLQLCLHSVCGARRVKGAQQPQCCTYAHFNDLSASRGIGATVIVEFGPTVKLNLVVHCTGLVHFGSGV